MGKKCFKCGKFKLLTEFYIHPGTVDGHLGKCKNCTRYDSCSWRNKNLEKVRAYDRARGNRLTWEYLKRYRRENPEKYKAHTIVANAVRRGKLKRYPCEICGEKAHAHHDNYSQPLNIRWLCAMHHKQHHVRRLMSPETFGFKPGDSGTEIVMKFPDFGLPEKIDMPDENLDTRSVAMLVKANAFQCINPDAYKDGDLAVSECAALVKRIHEIHDPVCKATNLAHRASTKARNDLIDPIEQASKIIDDKLGNYKMAHDRKIAEETKFLQEEAQKEQQKAAVAQAEEMKKEGALSEVIDLVLQSADDPVEAPTPETPQLHSKNSRTLDWKIEIIDKSLVPEHYKTIVVDEISILKKVRTEKGNLSIPGVRIVETFKTRRKAL